MLKALLISLQTAPERRAFQVKQAQELGLDLEILAAFKPDDLSAGADLAWDRWHRPLMPTEKACFLSHRAAWQRVQALQQPCLILEDDALLSRRLPAFLSRLDQVQGVDRLSLEVRLRKKLLGRCQPLAEGLGYAPLHQDRTGAAAYVLWPRGAQVLLQKAVRQGPALADAFINDSTELLSAQAVPALAIQADVAQAYGVVSALVTNSYIQAQGARHQHAASGLMAWVYKRRRLAGQLALAARLLRHVGHARRCDVPLDAPGFTSAG